jgi:iron complex outermembrane recepter protein
MLGMHNKIPGSLRLINQPKQEFMKNFFRSSLWSLLLIVLCSVGSLAQTTVSGTVTDALTGEAVPGANIKVKDRVSGTITGSNGTFTLKVNDPPPFTLVISFVGYQSQELAITDANSTNLSVKLEEQVILGQEIVVSASRVEESILKSPVTVEKVDLIGIQQTPAPEFYDALANVKGVQFTSSSINFPQVNTRGFATIANTRFVQMIDGIDTQAPLLNFPTGNIVGIGELDAESMELLPGAASALYGPNAFNGILIMRSKSPFEYQGLSAQTKIGVTNSDAQGETHPLYNFGIRYAKAFNNKFAFKINFSYLKATDWKSNDYKTDINRNTSTTDLSGTKDFDGVNLYGDEAEIPIPLPSIGIVHRTGFREEDIIDNYDAKSIKGDIALHYRLSDRLEAIYNFRIGGGNSVYQGSQKYALREFTQQFHKLELKGSHFFVRTYVTATDAGKSYNMGALGAFMNEDYNPTVPEEGDPRTGWATDYVLAMQGYIPGFDAGNHDDARAYADRDRPAVGTTEFKALADKIRSYYFQRTPPGAAFKDNSRLYHAEFNYNFADKIKFAEIQLGGNLRRYSLFSDGTIFNEAPEEGQSPERIDIDEYGMYTQITKTIADVFKITASVRYDKNENFDGRVTPRISGVYTVNENHNFRVSYQTGFRNPDTQAQYIYFPAGVNTLIGSSRANAERYGIFEGGAYTRASFDEYRATGGSISPDGTLVGGDQTKLKEDYVNYIKPEQLKSYEIGYKGLFSTNLLVDLNFYYTEYKDFIGGADVVSKLPTTHQGNQVDAGSIWSPYRNESEKVTSSGIGIGITYNFLKGYSLNGNYNYATFEVKEDESSSFRAGFNTPENKFSIGFGNRRVTKSLGFNVNYRYQDSFVWQSDFGDWIVPEFGVFDAQISYKVPSLKSLFKLGGTNLFGGDYRTNFGGPFVGQTYYISITFDEFFK